MKKIICFLLVGSGFACSAYSQKISESKLLRRIDHMIAERYKNVAPGCAVLIAKNGKAVFEKAYGMANLELNVAMTTENVFRIGSITKEFTAAAILQLEEEGKLSLKDSLQKFITYFPSKGYTITLENLLTHTSGIIDFQLLNMGLPDAIRVGFPPKRIIDSLKDRPLEFVPGSKYNYSNTNFFLLGMIIEKISGESYIKYMEEHILKPAGLKDTRYDDPVKIVRSRCSGYRKQDGEFVNADYISMNWPYAAGALQSTANDLYKWHQSLVSYKIIKKETLLKATTSFKLANGQDTDYGYGFFIKQWKGLKCIGHGGAIDGFRTMAISFPDNDLYVTMLFNSEEESFLDLFEDVFSILAGMEPVGVKDIKIDDKIMDDFSGTYAFEENPAPKIIIYKQNGRLYADLSNRTGMHMVLRPQNQTLFSLPDVKRIPTTIEFIMKNDKVAGLYWTQELKHVANKLNE